MKTLQTLVVTLLFVSVTAGLVYFTGCAPTAQQQQTTMSPEREKAIKDSLMRVYKYELAKQWSTGYEYYNP